MTERQSCDVELLCNGGFSPLTGFMTEEEYGSVINSMKLPNGLMFSLPVVFDTDSEELGPGSKILLKQGDLDVATFTVTDKRVRRAASPQAGRGTAAAATWICRGDTSRRRRGRIVRGYDELASARARSRAAVVSARIDSAAAATWMVRGSESRRRRGREPDRPRRSDARGRKRHWDVLVPVLETPPRPRRG